MLWRLNISAASSFLIYVYERTVFYFDAENYRECSSQRQLGAFWNCVHRISVQAGWGNERLPKRDWPDEDGEDTYIPDKLLLKAYDLEAEMCYKGDLGTAYDKIMAFQNYLTGENGDGATLKIYNSHTGIGRQGLYLLEVGDFEFNKSNMDEVLTFPVKFRVTDPRTQIIPSYSVAEPTKIVALVEKV